MPGKLKVRILAGRDLPVMDRSTDLTDAFVEVKFGSETVKTDVFKKSLNPHWNSEWFIFEVEDNVLQDEPLEIRVLDYDTYSAHDAIGKVYVDLNPLLSKETPNMISGWFPIYDTMHGIRGELNIIVRVELFTAVNKFRKSSCGVQFFSTAEVPSGYRLQIIHGFVEELVVNDDPEYKWIDKIRTPRASNEARQRLFSRLSGELQRKIGVKVLDLGGNAIIGYYQCFDLEGESGIVARGIGTVVNIAKILQQPPSPQGVSPLLKDLRLYSIPHRHTQQSVTPPTRYTQHSVTPPSRHPRKIPTASPPPSAPPSLPGQSAFSFAFSSPVPEDTLAPSSPPVQPVRSTTSPVKMVPPSQTNRRSSDSDISTNTPPKGSSLTGSSGSGSGIGSGGKSVSKLSAQQPSIDLMEYPFFTMTSFPVGFISHLGGVVSAKSVKLLDKIHNPEEPETRDVWWLEIRTEIRSHMRAMGCHAVLGYTEQTSICDEIIVLSASGTAARVQVTSDTIPSVKSSTQPLVPSMDRLQLDKDREKRLFVDVNLANQVSQNRLSYEQGDEVSPTFQCSLCHIPYKSTSLPFPVNLSSCAICRKKKVPDVLFTTIDLPTEIQTHGKGSLIQARVCKGKLKAKGELSAKEVSDSLPFLEYELHNQLMNKLKLRGMNGLFGLRIQISVGDTYLIGIATATAVFLSALPPPLIPKVSGPVTSDRECNQLNDLQRKITETVQRNKEIHELNNLDTGQTSPRSLLTDDSEDDVSELELSTGNKDTFILEVDDTRDQNIASLLRDSVLPDWVQMCNTQKMPGTTDQNMICNLQMFTQVLRREFNPAVTSNSALSDMFENLIRKICFKLRKMAPCCVCNLDFNIDLPEENEIQINLTGVCIGLSDVSTRTSSVLDLPTVSKSSLLKTAVSETSKGSEQEDMMFQMEELSDSSSCSIQGLLKGPKQTKSEQTRLFPVVFPKHRVGIELTPLPYIPRGRIERYLGHYNFFFIRETGSLREIGGLGGFMQSFIAEVLANVRATVAGLGGNGMVAYRMTECVLMCNPHKNQAQCLINIRGDTVSFSYDSEIYQVSSEPSRKNSDSPIIINTERINS
ncbi:C2 domain-containing protein 5-like isoform X2 [Mytilus galloprovincialis]|uniref:C2 domain-containing protein 5-like isoform X2 n=1 Tax=Mytilus galloprovincialis TaxID=29158 RepID=UPI003F7B6486